MGLPAIEIGDEMVETYTGLTARVVEVQYDQRKGHAPQLAHVRLEYLNARGTTRVRGRQVEHRLRVGLYELKRKRAGASSRRLASGETWAPEAQGKAPEPLASPAVVAGDEVLRQRIERSMLDAYYGRPSARPLTTSTATVEANVHLESYEEPGRIEFIAFDVPVPAGVEAEHWLSVGPATIQVVSVAKDGRRVDIGARAYRSLIEEIVQWSRRRECSRLIEAQRRFESPPQLETLSLGGVNFSLDRLLGPYEVLPIDVECTPGLRKRDVLEIPQERLDSLLRWAIHVHETTDTRADYDAAAADINWLEKMGARRGADAANAVSGGHLKRQGEAK